ncbi:leptin receptor isoform X2 [Engystomops pustulosus]|uniref:leptin receptor isoform X2 n=1 Tax=Engystomops pustulosus TaxID=76066 RepID=UPI003AFAF0B7
MILQWILAALLQECLTLYIVSPEVHVLPPSGLYLSYLLTNASSDHPPLEGLVAEQHEAPQRRNFSCIKTGEYSVLCLWKRKEHDADTIVEDYEEIKKISFPADSLLVDHTWKLQCFTGENTTGITCETHHVTQDGFMQYMLHLYYQRNDKDEDEIGADCRCGGADRCRCHLSPAAYNDSYLLWMEIVTPVTSLRSPPILLRAAAIIKPDPPGDLRAEITSDGKLKVLWTIDGSWRLQCQVKHYVNSTEEISPPSYSPIVHIVVEKTFVILDVPESCSPLVFEVRCRKFPELGPWSNWSLPMIFKSQDGYYFPQRVVVSSGSSASVFCMFCDQNKKVPSGAISWGLNFARTDPSWQYSAVSQYVAKITIDNLNMTTPKGKFNIDALVCCIKGIECQPRYAEIYAIDTNINIMCEANGDITNMSCWWTPKQVLLPKDIKLTFRYYEELNYLFETDIKYSSPLVKSCEVPKNGSYRCDFHRVRSVYIYHMWVEIQHPGGTLRSPPVSLKPSEVVKPFTPVIEKAEMMVDTEQDSSRLHVTWSRPTFVVYNILYQLRYQLRGQEAAWQVVDIYEKEWADLPVVDPCEAYTIQVRCQLVNLSSIWSDWSDAVHKTVKDIHDPLRGPEFWRILTKSHLQKGDNVTLVWKPLQNKESLCSVQGYELVQQASNISHSTYVGNVTNYTLTLSHNVSTVTIRAVNSLGKSTKNHNLTLSADMSAVKAVQTLDLYAKNGTALAVWKMSPVPYNLQGLVLEWKNLRKRSQVQWTYIPPNVRRYYIEGQFLAIEKYKFSLTPVFLEGVGRPHITYEFSKDVDEMQNNTGLYIILPVLTATSFLLVITFAISHQRMKRLFWKEVPNPKYCSWAQGVNFQKIH